MDPRVGQVQLGLPHDRLEPLHLQLRRPRLRPAHSHLLGPGARLGDASLRHADAGTRDRDLGLRDVQGVQHRLLRGPRGRQCGLRVTRVDLDQPLALPNILILLRQDTGDQAPDARQGAIGGIFNTGQ